MALSVQEITDLVKQQSYFVDNLFSEISKVIVGQKYLIERLLIGLIADGHILIEGVPGLAKTTAVKTLSSAIKTRFQRIQFTPDLLPADLIGTQVYNPQNQDFSIKKGPIFSNIILADEINRAPAKVQSALLEAMQERQVTIGETTFKLDEPFLVLATQNPIEQEGTYPLPEAQVDRFLFKLKVGYPTKEEEKEIMTRRASRQKIDVNPITEPTEILKAREIADQIYIDEKLQDYIVDIVWATREPHLFGLEKIKRFLEFGASPRATINLNLATKAYAFVKGKGYVNPADVKAIGADVLRHRIILSYEAEAEDMTPDDIINQIFDKVEIP